MPQKMEHKKDPKVLLGPHQSSQTYTDDMWHWVKKKKKK